LRSRTARVFFQCHSNVNVSSVFLDTFFFPRVLVPISHPVPLSYARSSFLIERLQFFPCSSFKKPHYVPLRKPQCSSLVPVSFLFFFGTVFKLGPHLFFPFVRLFVLVYRSFFLIIILFLREMNPFFFYRLVAFPRPSSTNGRELFRWTPSDLKKPSLPGTKPSPAAFPLYIGDCFLTVCFFRSPGLASSQGISFSRDGYPLSSSRTFLSFKNSPNDIVPALSASRMAIGFFLEKACLFFHTKLSPHLLCIRLWKVNCWSF